MITKVFQVKSESFNDSFNEVSSQKVGLLFDAIKILKTESFRAFLNSDPTDFPEIDAIKANFKDAEGILDIDKLGAYLKTKPKELEKYGDY